MMNGCGLTTVVIPPSEKACQPPVRPTLLLPGEKGWDTLIISDNYLNVVDYAVKLENYSKCLKER